jgi:hypothetical protein
MSWSHAKLPPEVLLLLDRERLIAILPAAARARALSRARASLLAGLATRPIPSGVSPTARWATAAALACVATVAVGAAAYELGVRARTTAPPVATLAPANFSPADFGLGARPTSDPTAASAPTGRPPSGAGAVRAEMRLLQRARVAVAREDFAPALQLLAEHARRFKRGRLAEEREALRVKALAGLDRRDDARRAAAEFAANFPRSPLLRAVRQMPDSAP